MRSSPAIIGANSSDFAVLSTGNPCGAGIAPGKSCTLPVQFQPVTAAAYGANLTITTNGGASPVIPLTGTGN